MASHKQSSNPNNRNYPEETREMAYQLWLTGLTFTQIAEKTGVPHGTLGGWVRKLEWKGRMIAEKQAGRDLRPEMKDQMQRLEKVEAMAKLMLPPEEDEQDLDYTGMTRPELASIYLEKMAQFAMRIPAMLAKLPDSLVLDRAEKIAKLVTISQEALGVKDRANAPLVNINLVSGGGLPQPLSGGGITVTLGEAEEGAVPALVDATS